MPDILWVFYLIFAIVCFFILDMFDKYDNRSVRVVMIALWFIGLPLALKDDNACPITRIKNGQ
jgi:hypothetical protein